MPQQVRTRRQTTLAYLENQAVSDTLSRGMLYREIILRLKLTVNAAAGFALSHLQAGDEWAVVKRLQLIANGSDVLRSITGEQLAWLNFFMLDVRRKIANWSFGDNTTTIESTLILPIWSPKSIRPMDTVLDSRLLSDLRVEVQWGDITSITSHAGDAFSVNPTLEIYSYESFGVDGPFSQSRVHRIINSSVTASDQFEVKLPVGPMYRGFLLSCKDANGADLASKLDNIKLRSGTTVFYDLPGSVVQQWFKLRYGIDEFQSSFQNALTDSSGGTSATELVASAGANPTAAEFENNMATIATWLNTLVTGAKRSPVNFASAESNIDGWYYVDLVGDGFLSESIDTLGFAELVLDLKTNDAIATLEVLPLSIIPVRGNG